MMTDDRPLDAAARRLFSAARRESPSPELRARTLAAMVDCAQKQSARRWLPLRIAIPAVLAAAAALLLFMVLPPISPKPLAISAERLARHSASAPNSPATASIPSSVTPLPSAIRTIESEHPALSRSARPRLSPAPSAPQRRLSLNEEIDIIDNARTALRGGDSARALKLLDSYDRAGSRRLSDESALVRIDALSHAGQAEAAKALAQKFIESNPNSPLIDRARTFLDTDSRQ